MSNGCKDCIIEYVPDRFARYGGYYRYTPCKVHSVIPSRIERIERAPVEITIKEGMTP